MEAVWEFCGWLIVGAIAGFSGGCVFPLWEWAIAKGGLFLGWGDREL